MRYGIAGSAVALGLAVGLAGCGGSGTGQDVSAASDSKASATASESPSAEVETELSYEHGLGKTVSYAQGGLAYDVTVLESRKVTDATLPEIDGDRFAILVKTCLQDGEPAEFGIFVWSARDSDGGRYKAQSYQPGAISGPEYGVSRVAPGSCVKGWIPFEVDDAETIDTAIYAPDMGDYAEWSLEG